MKLAIKAVFCWKLFGNSEDHDSELDLQVRRAFKKTPLVSMHGYWYHTATGEHELLDSKAGVQMRNFGVDFLFFGNVWDFAGFGLGEMAHYCGWTCKTTGPLDREDISAICKEIRNSCNATWAIGIRLVSKNSCYRRRKVLILACSFRKARSRTLTYSG
jgi:hypothetical protein